jgi:hypothetical protein
MLIASPSTPSVDRAVDVFSRPDGTLGFEEFRRDPEDLGAWTPVAYYSQREYATAEEAMSAARRVRSLRPRPQSNDAQAR